MGNREIAHVRSRTLRQIGKHSATRLAINRITTTTKLDTYEMMDARLAAVRIKKHSSSPGFTVSEKVDSTGRALHIRKMKNKIARRTTVGVVGIVMVPRRSSETTFEIGLDPDRRWHGMVILVVFTDNPFF